MIFNKLRIFTVLVACLLGMVFQSGFADEECATGILNENNVCITAKTCNAGECESDSGNCIKCTTGRYCDGSKHYWCKKYSDKISDSDVAPLCDKKQVSSEDGKSCVPCAYYTVTLNKNGGTDGSDYIYICGTHAYTSQYFNYNNRIVKSGAKINIPMKAGYRFNGYFCDNQEYHCINENGGYETELSSIIVNTNQTWGADWKECESGVSYNNGCKVLDSSYNSLCKAGQCRTLEGECVSCPAGRYCDGTKQLWCDKYSESSNLDPDTVAPLCPVNTYSDGGKTSCTSCGVGYTTGNSGPIVTDSEGNVSGDGLCLAFDDESSLGYGCTSSRACQMVTPQLCHGGCSCDAKTELDNAKNTIDKEKRTKVKTRLTNCGVPEAVAKCLLGNCDDIPTRPFRPIRRSFIGNSAGYETDNGIQSIITNAFLENKKLVRCFCNTSFGLGDNFTTVKTYSDVVDVVYPDDSASD